MVELQLKALLHQLADHGAPLVFSRFTFAVGDRRDGVGVTKQLRSPRPGAAGQLEHVAREPQIIQRCQELAAAADSAEQVLVVLGGDRSVKRLLFGENGVER